MHVSSSHLHRWCELWSGVQRPTDVLDFVRSIQISDAAAACYSLVSSDQTQDNPWQPTTTLGGARKLKKKRWTSQASTPRFSTRIITNPIMLYCIGSQKIQTWIKRCENIFEGKTPNGWRYTSTTYKACYSVHRTNGRQRVYIICDGCQRRGRAVHGCGTQMRGVLFF